MQILKISHLSKFSLVNIVGKSILNYSLKVELLGFRGI